eukprot:6341305-Amphidinium_carterae.1
MVGPELDCGSGTCRANGAGAERLGGELRGGGIEVVSDCEKNRIRNSLHCILGVSSSFGGVWDGFGLCFLRAWSRSGLVRCLGSTAGSARSPLNQSAAEMSRAFEEESSPGLDQCFGPGAWAVHNKSRYMGVAIAMRASMHAHPRLSLKKLVGICLQQAVPTVNL